MRPTIHAGPCIVTRGAHTWYTEGDVTVNLKRTTWNPKSAVAGNLGSRHAGQMFEISFNPLGALDVVAKYLPYAATQIGSLLFNDTATVIKTRAGKTVTYHNTAVTKLPGFKASPLSQLYSGGMTIVDLIHSNKELTDDAAFNTFAEAAFADTSWNDSKILTPRYIWNYGDEYENLESEEGFNFEFSLGVEFKTLPNWGPVNAILTDLTARCSFIPVGFDEDDLWKLMSVQGEDAILPGEELSKHAIDLVVSGGGASFTLHDAGPQDAQTRYGLTPLRLGEVGFISTKTHTTGALNPVFTVAFPA